MTQVKKTVYWLIINENRQPLYHPNGEVYMFVDYQKALDYITYDEPVSEIWKVRSITCVTLDLLFSPGERII